jgi:hypothetical protein
MGIPLTIDYLNMHKHCVGRNTYLPSSLAEKPHTLPQTPPLFAVTFFGVAMVDVPLGFGSFTRVSLQ